VRDNAQIEAHIRNGIAKMPTMDDSASPFVRINPHIAAVNANVPVKNGNRLWYIANNMICR
jgi:hypothetical protein